MGKKTGSKQKEVAAAVSGKQGPVIATTRTTRRALKATAPPGSSPPEDPVDTAATPKATIKPPVVQFAAIPVAKCGAAAKVVSKVIKVNLKTPKTTLAKVARSSPKIKAAQATSEAASAKPKDSKRKSRPAAGEPTVIDGTSLPLTTEELDAQASRRKLRREQKAVAAKDRSMRGKNTAVSDIWKKPLTLVEGMKASIITGETHAGKCSILSKVMAICERDQARYVTLMSRPVRLTLGCPFECDFRLDAAFQTLQGKVFKSEIYSPKPHPTLPKPYLGLTKTTC